VFPIESCWSASVMIFFIPPLEAFRMVAILTFMATIGWVVSSAPSVEPTLNMNYESNSSITSIAMYSFLCPYTESKPGNWVPDILSKPDLWQM
jgi:hypothetical protein